MVFTSSHWIQNSNVQRFGTHCGLPQSGMHPHRPLRPPTKDAQSSRSLPIMQFRPSYREHHQRSIGLRAESRSLGHGLWTHPARTQAGLQLKTLWGCFSYETPSFWRGIPFVMLPSPQKPIKPFPGNPGARLDTGVGGPPYAWRTDPVLKF